MAHQGKQLTTPPYLLGYRREIVMIENYNKSMANTVHCALQKISVDTGLGVLFSKRLAYGYHVLGGKLYLVIRSW
jgi:hypothetical protein